MPRMGDDDVAHGPDDAFRGAIHDLKNLLNAVVIGAELLARQCDGEEREHVEIVKVAVFRLAHRVDDFRAAFVSKAPGLSAASAPTRTR